MTKIKNLAAYPKKSIVIETKAHKARNSKKQNERMLTVTLRPRNPNKINKTDDDFFSDEEMVAPNNNTNANNGVTPNTNASVNINNSTNHNSGTVQNPIQL